jgi:hypothetical protein
LTDKDPHPEWIVPDWPAPETVRAFITTRSGGLSQGPFGSHWLEGGMNVGMKSGDAAETVRHNRKRLHRCLPEEPRWLQQVHGARVESIDEDDEGEAADAAISLTPGRVCVVSVADCLPVLFAERNGRAVGVAHAGWRGLAAGVIQNTARSIRRRLLDEQAQLLAFLGPAIGPAHFQVGAEVLEAMWTHLPDAERAFVAEGNGKYRADLFELARQALAQAGITAVSGGGLCTFSDAERFYSFRRDGVTGRHAALIWIEDEASRVGTKASV